jgi:U4/U6.U5 tri-snRNP component SNU23
MTGLSYRNKSQSTFLHIFISRLPPVVLLTSTSIAPAPRTLHIPDDQPEAMPDDKKKPAYGIPSTDTSFRRTWDRIEYAAKAAAQEATAKEESKARYEAKLAGRKYYKPAPPPEDLEATTSRAERLDVSSQIGKTSLVPAGAAIGKRGRGAGFYCLDCDLTFKDNLQLVEHLNSKQHLIATGQSGEVKRASLEEVRERLQWLRDKRDREEEERKREGEVDLQQRLKNREELDEKEREEKRRKRNEKRRKGGDAVKKEDEWEGRLGIIS